MPNRIICPAAQPSQVSDFTQGCRASNRAKAHFWERPGDTLAGAMVWRAEESGVALHSLEAKRVFEPGSKASFAEWSFCTATHCLTIQLADATTTVMGWGEVGAESEEAQGLGNPPGCHHSCQSKQS